MSHAFYDRYMASTTSLTPHKGRQNLVTANDTALTTIGKATVKFKVRGCLLSAEFYVIDKTSYWVWNSLSTRAHCYITSISA